MDSQRFQLGAGSDGHPVERGKVGSLDADVLAEVLNHDKGRTTLISPGGGTGTINGVNG